MSRRKQPKPQHIQSNDLSLTGNTEAPALSADSPPAVDPGARVCSRCCAEFMAVSDLEQHQRDCSSTPPVLIVNNDEDLLSASKTFPAASSGGEQTVSSSEKCDSPAQDRSTGSAEFTSCFSSRRSHSGGTDSVFCTSASLPHHGCSADQRAYSWMNVITENLESTKVAMAQFSQQTPSQWHHSKTTTSSLLQQLFALQIQQIHQLQLIDQIRHQVLLFASHRAETPENLVICTEDLSSSNSTNQLAALSAHLSQQLAAAAGIARSLSAQSANLSDFQQFSAMKQLNPSQPDREVQSSETSQTELVTSAVQQHMHCDFSDSQLDFLSQTNTSSLMFSNNHFVSKNSENCQLAQPPSTCEHTASSSAPNISAIVEDLDALAALAQQRKCRNWNLSESTSSEEFFFKCKCRFCSRVFGSDSALQIHLRSHTRERPYKCNVCGNRFSTRGILKLHFQRHKQQYPHIQMKPYPLPKHLDNIQINAGIPHSMSPEKAAGRRFDVFQSPTTLSSGAATNLFSLIKKEEQPISVPTAHSYEDLHFDSAASMDFRSAANLTKTMKLKSEDVDVLPNPFTCPTPASFSGFLPLKHAENPKLRLRSETTDKTVSDPNECLICHRILSCQGALRMHYRTHTGERPYQCKLCSRAFTTKGNLKTHQAVHHATIPLGVQHPCPICQMKFTNAVVLQQHVHMHMEDHVPRANRNYPLDSDAGFKDKAKVMDGSDGGFCENRLSKFKSLSIHLSPSSFGKNLTENKKTSYREPQLLKWIKTEKSEGPNMEYSPTNTQQAETFPISDSSASTPNGQASLYFKTSNLDKHFQTWLSSPTLTLCASATAPTDLNALNHTEDSPHLVHSLREKGTSKNTFCDVCGKNFACQSALDIHYRSHTKERPFICTACSKGFSTKGNLKQHMLTHQMRNFPPRLFEPSNSNQASNHNSSILSTGSQPVKTEMSAFLSCSVGSSRDPPGHSQSSSVSESALCAVAPARRTPKHHHCKTCGKSFSSTSALQIHERTHTGERPFSCTVCGRAFTTKGNLKVHMGTHMWNSAPSRRGRRLSVDRLSVGFRTHPVKLPEPPPRNPAMVSSGREPVYHWNQSPELFSAGLKMNDVCLVQGEDTSLLSGHVGLNERTPVDSTDVCLHPTDLSDPPVYGRNN